MTKEVIRAVMEVLEKGENGVLVTLCSTDGSTPRKPGAKMLVYPGFVHCRDHWRRVFGIPSH